MAQFLALGLAGEAAFLQLAQLGFRDEVDRAEAFALGELAIEPGRFHLDGCDLRLLEAGRFGKQRRRAFEFLARDARHFLAARLLRLGAGGGAGAGLAGGGLRLASLGELRLGRAQRLLGGTFVRGGGLGGFCGGDRLGGHRLQLRVQRFRRFGEPLRFGFRFGDPAAELGVAGLGLDGATLPIGLLGLGGFGALLVGGDGAGMGGGLGADLGERRLGALGRGAQLGHVRLGGRGVGKRGGDLFRASEAAPRVRKIRFGQGGALGEPAASQFQPLDLDLGIVLRAARFADCGAGFGFRAAGGIGGLARRLHSAQSLRS